MAGKRGGLHSYTVQEAQNSSMGQVGSVFLDTSHPNMNASTWCIFKRLVITSSCAP